MKGLYISFALLGLLLVVPAYASQCPGDMAQIDAALEGNPSISAAKLAEVKRLRAEGGQLHSNGKHGQSVKALAEAKAILGI